VRKNEPSRRGATRAPAAARVLLLALALAPVGGTAAAATPTPAPTYAELLAALPDAVWLRPDPTETLYLDIPGGRVVIVLAADFAPSHRANVRRLVRAQFFDGLHVNRVQDNYVTQWGNNDGERALPPGIGPLKAEFDRSIDTRLPFRRLADGDVYATEAGLLRGFPVARDPRAGRMWLAHCYGMVGVGRDEGADTGSGEELYVVIGHAPRHLDRNVTLIGRVVSGMEYLAALPRGHADMGFYDETQSRPTILAMRVAADLPPAERLPIEVLNTSAPEYERLVEARRRREDAFFITKAGRLDLCNAPLPVRLHPGS
jgi:peptidylprolyl isomerase